MYQANKDGCTILFDNKRPPAVALTCIPEVFCPSSFNVIVPSISPSAQLALLEMVGDLPGDTRMFHWHLHTLSIHSRQPSTTML